MLTVFAGIYLFFFAESFIRSAVVIWRRLTSSKNSFELDHEINPNNNEWEESSKTNNHSMERIPESVATEPSDSISSNNDDHVYVISHKALRRTFRWDHRRRQDQSTDEETSAKGMEMVTHAVAAGEKKGKEAQGYKFFKKGT